MLVVLGQDGVLTERRADGGARDAPLLSGAGAAVRRLNEAGWPIVVLLEYLRGGAGAYREAEDQLRDRLHRFGARVERVVASDIAMPDAAQMRTLLREHRVAPDAAVVIGDDAPLLDAAVAAGCRRLLVRTGKGALLQAAGIPAAFLPLGVHADLEAAVAALLGSGP